MFNEKFQKKTTRILCERDERRAKLEQFLLEHGLTIMEDGVKELMARATQDGTMREIMAAAFGLIKVKPA